ncbi:hypothetical protein DTO006G1_4538 [Penicillium roqueforti]|nr:hypothetical protein CBS147337_1026 [Penicillium roqueforti]KAI2689297.1 hypothetical protein LCP963914a_2386 [Penicillium roqueforti]KAI2760497.1 hypothetical protein DTO006G1_4538 [Penicillium roqueforti]KAI3143505.1 hypothetical protein CBS147330_1292 [Penicillium roqueforti]KAI3177067.1 hypothetical protein DTO039G3_426 [Penicillium roqueforti]
MLPSILGLCAWLSLFTTSVLASPIQLSRQEISSELLDNFKFFAQVAAVAMSDVNLNTTGRQLSCDKGPCELVQADDTEITSIYHGAAIATGYIALDHTRKLILVTFRGTVTTADLYQDLRIPVFTDVSEICEGCKAHTGFWNYWLSAKDQVTAELRRLIKENPTYGVVVTGYSLGAAVATLAGTALRVDGFTLDVWTFGAPKTGNLKMAEFITQQHEPVSVYRATHHKDLIPAIPFISPGFDYTHPSPEYWIDQPSFETVTPDVVKVIKGINNQTGNAGQRGRRITEEHEWYFGEMFVYNTPADFGAIF